MIQNVVERGADSLTEFVFLHARNIQTTQIECRDHFHVRLFAQFDTERAVDWRNRQRRGGGFLHLSGLYAQRGFGRALIRRGHALSPYRRVLVGGRCIGRDGVRIGWLGR